ncbi:uncharacterized protein FA14DRAFT_159433 [Meira miltonrushii]|uniref:Structure-specific endonuclease subunit SLX4 n=1 Tax=Meira miltonrushii TaxID=1280837 RepID=A0A316VP89_9BASI|nr:uncharacterized protein FA14DRAFT_159433 [Meira miltonrushii]PWN37335.1 hypothetical protein FA14DRAFT_159433 [Meira miltonrushii]
MGLLDELDRLGTDQNGTSKPSIAGPSRSREGGTNAHHNKDRKSASLQRNRAQVRSDHSEDDESIAPVVLNHTEDEGDQNAEARMANMSIDELREQINKYGLRLSKSRKVMIEQLQSVYRAIRQAKAVKDTQVGDTSSLFSSDRDESGEDNDDDEEEESDDEPLARQATTKKAAALGNIPKGNGAFEANVPAVISQQLHDALMSDENLYRRILLFEPVPFEEVSALAKKAGVQGLRSKEILRNWLDVQCICFYSGELTGQRHRY